MLLHWKFTPPMLDDKVDDWCYKQEACFQKMLLHGIMDQYHYIVLLPMSANNYCATYIYYYNDFRLELGLMFR